MQICRGGGWDGTGRSRDKNCNQDTLWETIIRIHYMREKPTFHKRERLAYEYKHTNKFLENNILNKEMSCEKLIKCFNLMQSLNTVYYKKEGKPLLWLPSLLSHLSKFFKWSIKTLWKQYFYKNEKNFHHI